MDEPFFEFLRSSGRMVTPYLKGVRPLLWRASISSLLNAWHVLWLFWWKTCFALVLNFSLPKYENFGNSV